MLDAGKQGNQGRSNSNTDNSRQSRGGQGVGQGAQLVTKRQKVTETKEVAKPKQIQSGKKKQAARQDTPVVTEDKKLSKRETKNARKRRKRKEKAELEQKMKDQQIRGGSVDLSSQKRVTFTEEEVRVKHKKVPNHVQLLSVPPGLPRTVS